MLHFESIYLALHGLHGLAVALISAVGVQLDISMCSTVWYPIGSQTSQVIREKLVLSDHGGGLSP